MRSYVISSVSLGIFFLLWSFSNFYVILFIGMKFYMSVTYLLKISCKYTTYLDRAQPLPFPPTPGLPQHKSLPTSCHTYFLWLTETIFENIILCVYLCRIFVCGCKGWQGNDFVGLILSSFHLTGPRDWNEIIKILSHLPGFIASLKLKLFFYNILNFVMLLIWFFCHCQFNDFIVQFLSKWKA